MTPLELTPSETNTKPVASLDYHHPLEKWLRHDWLRWILRKLTADRPGSAQPHLERALLSYADPQAPFSEKMLYWPIHKAIDQMRGSLTPQQLRAKLAGHPPTLRGIIATTRSVAHFGLTTPQRWLHPLFVVWNFTNRCNLRCNHCYQNSTNQAADGELTLEQRLDLIDQFGKHYIPMVALAGGEPTLSPDLEPVLDRCRKYGIHTTIATHGGLLTPERCRRLADLGLRYVEVSLDSIHPEVHDRFRGVEGMWQQSIEGIKNVIATDGLRAGIAMCVHQDNFKEVEPMIELAVKLGVSCFAHFNFIPVGRGKEMSAKDLTPHQREELLHILHHWMQKKIIGIISTAPQFGRISLANADENGIISCSHAGNGPGTKARVVAKYLGGCGAGRTYACLQPNGDVTPCVYMPGRIMGNVKEKSFSEIFQQSPWWDLFCNRQEREGSCATCEYRNFCGGCRARADAYFGRIDEADPGCLANLEDWKRITG